MPTKFSKQVFDALAKLGFEDVWSNAQGFPCFVHPDDPQQTEVSVNPSIDAEHTARFLIRRCQKIVGQLPKIEKRKGQQVKDRQAADRERAEQRLRWAEEKRLRLLAEKGTAEHLQRIDELIELRRRQLLDLHRQMTQTPQGSQHRGHGRVEYQGTAHDRTPL